MSSPPVSRHALTFIVATALLNSIGFGIIMPVMPALLGELSGASIGESAAIGGYLMVLYAVMQFFMAPVIGNLSDRFGRRPVMLVSLVAFGLDFILMGLAPTLVWLFVARGIAGAAGATYATANAYIADITPPEKRPQSFGLLGMAFGMGFIIGPLIGGFLGEYGSRVPFFVAGGLALANAVFGFFALPESLPKSERRAFSFARANPVGAIRKLATHRIVFIMAGAYFLFQLAHHVLPSTWSFYVIERFDWSQTEIGWSLAFVGVLMALVQGGLIRWAIPRFGVIACGMVGFATTALGFVGYALAGSSAMMYFWMAASALQGLVTPALQGVMTQQLPANEQGELQGALASLSGFGSIISPLLMTQLFAYFTSGSAPFYFPGAAFIMGAVLIALGGVLFIVAARRSAAATAVS